MSYFVLCREEGRCSRIRVRDANRVQECCNRLNWGARDHSSRAPPVTTTHVCFFSVVTRCACIRVFIILIILLHVGFVSNGEYNVFRAKWYTRPLSVLRLRSLARNKFARMSVSKMEKIISPTGE